MSCLVLSKFSLLCTSIMYDKGHTVYPKKYAHGFVVLCFVVVMQSFIMNSHEVFIHIHQGCFAGTGAIVRLPQCQWSKPDGCGKIGQCITTTKHSKAKTVCIFLAIYCTGIGFSKFENQLFYPKSSLRACNQQIWPCDFVYWDWQDESPQDKVEYAQGKCTTKCLLHHYTSILCPFHNIVSWFYIHTCGI